MDTTASTKPKENYGMVIEGKFTVYHERETSIENWIYDEENEDQIREFDAYFSGSSMRVVLS